MIQTVSSGTRLRRRADPERLPVVVLNFGSVRVTDTAAVGRVAETIVSEHARGVNVVAVLPAYGHALDELSQLASAVSASPHPRELDMLVSSGAAMATALCTMAVQGRGCRAVSLEGSQAGIVTDAAHTRAEVVEVRTSRIEAELRRHGIVLLSGVQGVARETGEPTILAPGGHDVAALALARALGADVCVVVSGAVNGTLTVATRTLADGALCSSGFDASLREG
jgi:aspartate kinase